MSCRHLSCGGCRIRIRADAREIDLLDGRCPICAEALGAISPASSVLGFRAFDLDAFSDHPSTKLPSATGDAVDLVARDATASATNDFAADRWTDDGGAVDDVVARRPVAGLIGASALA
jgi:hypothetical protein